MSNNLSLKQITDQLGGEVSGNDEVIVSRVGSLAFANQGAIGFFNDTKYSTQLRDTKASAVILKPEHASLTDLPVIVTDNPYAYFAKVSQLLNPVETPKNVVHETAVIHASAKVAKNCSIDAHVVIGENVVLGKGVVIAAGCIVERDSRIGEASILEANVTVKHGSHIGMSCHLFSGCVIGNDGFGYAEETKPDNTNYWIKIPQVGRAIIEDNVDIGSNTTIDRGAIDDTLIQEGVKIDNLVQIAHNCRIGAHTVIAGCVGIAGSAVIGEYCKIGGAAMILGHLSIASHVTISPGSMIMRSIRKKGTYTALMPSQEHGAWLKTAANIRHLNQLTGKIKTLETTIKKLENSRKL